MPCTWKFSRTPRDVPNKKEIRLYTKTITSQLNDYYEINYTNSLDLDFQIYGFTENELKNLEVKISFSNQDIFTYEYLLTKKNNHQTDLTFKLQSVSSGINDIKITIISGKHIYNKKITVRVLEWIVEAVPNATYGFALNTSDFYESQNKRRSSSYAMCKVIIKNPSKLNVYFDCINYAGYGDYGYLSKVDTQFSHSYNKDDTSLIYYDFYNKDSPDIVTVDYGPIEGTIYIKYIKDWDYNPQYGSHYNNDSLQFKVRVE